MHRSKKLRLFVAQETCQHAGGWQSAHTLLADRKSEPLPGPRKSADYLQVLSILCSNEAPIPKFFEKHHDHAWIEINISTKRDAVRIGCPAISPGFQEVANLQGRKSKKSLAAIDVVTHAPAPRKNAFMVERN
jgi:hypothetical protein